MKTAIHIEPTHGLPPLALGELWAARETLLILTWRDIKVRYKQTLLGATWAILQPLLTMVVLSVFLGLLAKVPSQGLPYPLLVFGALVPWTFIAYCLTQAGQSLVTNEDLLTKVYFPRLVIPLSAVLAGLVDFALAFVALLGMMAFYGHGPSVTALLLPLPVLLAMIAALGAGFWLSALNVRYRDVRYTIVFLTQLLFYLSPIAYPSTLVPEGLRAIYGLNPISGVVESFRGALLGTPVSAPLIASSAAMATVLLVTGWLYFKRVEREFADVI